MFKVLLVIILNTPTNYDMEIVEMESLELCQALAASIRQTQGFNAICFHAGKST